MTASLEQRIARLEALEAVKILIAGFARGADAGCDPGLLRPLFTDDARFDIDRFGSMEGGDEIAAQMHRNTDRGFNWTVHYLTTPVIELADDLESGRCFFYLWEVATHPTAEEGDKAYWIGGWYDAELECVADGSWRFSHLRLTIKLMSPYGEGWQPVPERFEDL